MQKLFKYLKEKLPMLEMYSAPVIGFDKKRVPSERSCFLRLHKDIGYFPVNISTIANLVQCLTSNVRYRPSILLFSKKLKNWLNVLLMSPQSENEVVKGPSLIFFCKFRFVFL